MGLINQSTVAAVAQIIGALVEYKHRRSPRDVFSIDWMAGTTTKVVHIIIVTNNNEEDNNNLRGWWAE